MIRNPKEVDENPGRFEPEIPSSFMPGLWERLKKKRHIEENDDEDDY